MPNDSRQADAYREQYLRASTQNEFFEIPDRLRDIRSDIRHRRNDRIRWNAVNFGEEYIRGRLDIVVALNAKSGRRLESNRTLPEAARVDRINNSLFVGSQINQCDPRYVAEMKDWRDDRMLISVVENVKGVEGFTGSIRVQREADEKVSSILSGCYHSSRRGFKIYPRAADGHFGMAVRCSTVELDKLPYQVVQHAPVIVDRVPQNQGQRVRNFSVNSDLNPNAPKVPILTLTLDVRSVRAEINEVGEPIFEVSEVLVGPF